VGFITTQGQNVNIPDANFKAYLIGNSAINTNGDNQISVAEAQAFTGVIDCNSKNISNLTGIEAFVNMTILRCYNNQLSSLDVSNNTALTILACASNQLSSLDLSNNTALEYLGCNNNQLSSLDVSNNTVLKYLLCGYNQLSSLDVSNNTALLGLNCVNNQLISLNLKNGNNTNNEFFNTRNNSNLSCIQVDNVAYSNANWSYGKDVTACFSKDCVTPTFSPTTICAGYSISFPSTGSVQGSWSPSTINNTSSGTYTFTPTANQCGNPQVGTWNVTVNPTKTTPTFSPTTICSGGTIAFPSTGNVTGTWSPSTVSKTSSGTYTFTPTAGQCGNPQARTWNVTVNPTLTTPTFTATTICAGGTISFPSTGAVQGSWSPSTISNTSNGTYTFTPTANQCGNPQIGTWNVTVNPTLTTPTFAATTICAGSSIAFPSTGNNLCWI